MKITKITYSFSQTIQMKDYHPRSFHVSLEAEIDKEDPKYVHTELKKIAQTMIKKDVQEAEDKRKELRAEADKQL